MPSNTKTGGSRFMTGGDGVVFAGTDDTLVGVANDEDEARDGVDTSRNV